ncbi:exosomal 3 -5 exoribonuclease complex subunit [Cystoisospora suis]|uniref:Exosomal 3-5 exoribonuclease complex subunit n=1 Tax=Cystoisospora suis TaxID=483139 RepID=A0A2C6K9E0_9APIC|nr:exosomal 3 -5 exoribonuclease complex subunit [Cystoisospora suis]
MSSVRSRADIGKSPQGKSIPSLLPSLFLPGEPVLPLPSEKTFSLGGEEDGGWSRGNEAEEAVHRLAEISEDFDFASSAYLTAYEAMTASHGELQCSIPCTYTPRLPQYPYSPGYLSTGQSRYEPVQGDIVVGVVSGKRDEEYTVNIRARSDGLLPSIIGFEGATKRHHPSFSRGNLVLCQVARVSPELGTELTCVTSDCKKSWTSKEKILGELQSHPGCLVVDLPFPLAMSLSAPHCFVLESLGEQIPFEIAVGANGRVWIRGKTSTDAILVYNILLASYGKERHVTQAIINTLIAKRREGI